MNKLLFISALLLALNTNAEPPSLDLNKQQAQLQHAQQLLKQQISNEQIAIKHLKVLLESTKKIDTKKAIHFAGQSYSPMNFQLQVKLLQQQLQQKKSWLILSQQEIELLNSRISVIEWRIKTLAANQGESQ